MASRTTRPLIGPAAQSSVLRLPDRRVEREPLLGGFRCKDQADVLTAPRIVARREDKVFACKPYRVEEGRALYAGVLRPTARGGLSRWYPGWSSATATRGCAG